MIPGALVIEGHVQGLAIVRSLGKKHIPVFVVDNRKAICRYSRYCKKFFKCPDYLSDEFIDFIIDISKEYKLKDWILFPTNDHSVLNISLHKQKLLDYYNIITADYSIYKNIYSKTELLSICTELKLPVPKYTIIDNHLSGIENMRYPLLIKGIYGLKFYQKYKTKVFLAENRNELNTILEKISEDKGNIFIQEVIPDIISNKTISFTSFSIEGEIKTYWMGKKLREHPKRFGTATLCKSVFVPEILDESRRILKKLKYTGVCEIEYIKDPRDDQFKLIEINARTWLWLGLAIYCGIDYPVIVYNYVNGINNNYRLEYKTGVKWINLWTDFYFSFVRKGCSVKEYFGSFFGEVTFAILSFNDIKPFLFYSLFLSHYKKDR